MPGDNEIFLYRRAIGGDRLRIISRTNTDSLFLSLISCKLYRDRGNSNKSELRTCAPGPSLLRKRIPAERKHQRKVKNSIWTQKIVWKAYFNRFTRASQTLVFIINTERPQNRYGIFEIRTSLLLFLDNLFSCRAFLGKSRIKNMTIMFLHLFVHVYSYNYLYLSMTKPYTRPHLW